MQSNVLNCHPERNERSARSLRQDFRSKTPLRWAAAIAILMAAIGCGDSNVQTVDKSHKQPPATSATKPSSSKESSAPTGTGSAGSAAGIVWTVPDGWAAGGPRPMRAATYTIGNGADAAECAVFFFGEGQGGGVQDNIDRWIRQFTQPDGSDSKSKATTASRQSGGMNVTTIDLTGTYAASMGGPMSGKTEPRPGYRLLGAIVEAPQGPVFFKLTGPDVKISSAQSAFDGLISSVRRD